MIPLKWLFVSDFDKCLSFNQFIYKLRLSAMVTNDLSAISLFLVSVAPNIRWTRLTAIKSSTRMLEHLRFQKTTKRR